MKNPQFEQASFTYTYNEVTYIIYFTPQSNREWNVKVVDTDNEKLLMSDNKSASQLNANRTNAIFYLSVALNTNF